MKLPTFGIGTGGPSVNAISVTSVIGNILDAVLPMGVRLIDTAQWYENEHLVAEAMKSVLPKHNLKREDMIIVSKVKPMNHGYYRALESTRKSTSYFGYIDLMLIHWPGMQNDEGIEFMKDIHGKHIKVLRAETWKALEELKTEGLLKSIGVSNYTVDHLTELLGHCNIRPSVLQSEFHPRCQNEEIRAMCEDEGIQFMGYSPLGRKDLLENSIVTDVASRNNLINAQVLLKWGLQKGAIVIPGSSNVNRNIENIATFTDSIVLNQSDMELLDTLNDGYRYSWDPHTVI